jgi:hypothetical protein
MRDDPPRLGRLKNGNPPFDLRNVRRCGAKTRRGTPCKGPAMANGRCRMHGGPNPGPPRGNRNAWKHGQRSRAAVEERKARVASMRMMKHILRMLDKG